MHMFGEYGWGMGLLGMIAMVIFWVAIVAGAIYIIRLLATPHNPETRTKESPEEILKKRYARGEIGKEEFQQLLKDLRD